MKLSFTGWEKQDKILEVMQEIIMSADDKFKMFNSYRSPGLFAEVQRILGE
jgi:hypothetical protein